MHGAMVLRVKGAKEIFVSFAEQAHRSWCRRTARRGFAEPTCHLWNGTDTQHEADLWPP